MKIIHFTIVIFIVFCKPGFSQEIGNINPIDIAFYDSLCPGFSVRYKSIQNCKYSNMDSLEGNIKHLKSILNQIENQDGLFDDINYFEAIRLLGAKYLQKGDYIHIDSLLFFSKKYLLENSDSIFNFKDIYKYNRVATWIEMKEERFTSAIDLLKEIVEKESDKNEHLSALQDLALCYLKLKQYDDFSVIAKDAVEIADSIATNDYTFQLKLQSEKLKAYICIFSDNDIKKGTDLLESLALQLKDQKGWIRFRYTILNDLCDFYIYTDVKKYIKTKKEILHSGVLSDEEKVQILESLVGAEWLYAKDEDIINHAIQHNNLLKDIARNNFLLFTPTKNISKWPDILERIAKDSYVLNRFSNNLAICELCYDNQLFLKNQFISSDYALRQYVYLYGDTIQKRILSEIDSLREYVIYNGVENENIDSYPYAIAYKESELMKVVPLSEFIKSKIKTWKDVALSLSEDEIAIEIADCIVPFPKDSIYSNLMALVVTPNCDSPICIKLGNYYEIANELRMLFSKDPLEINRVYSSRNNSIYKLLWGKLKKYFNGVKTIFFSSNTLLSFVNLGALLSSDGMKASEEWNIRMLTSTSEIPHVNKKNNYSSLTLFGVGNFNVKGIKEDNLYAKVIRSLSNRGEFQELKGTIEEVNTIQHEIKNPHVSIQKFVGLNATESNFLLQNGNASQIIHIATHCFCIRDMNDSKYLSRLMAIDNREAGMLGTGFILANANSSWNGPNKEDNKKDGILLSEDISRLNLNGCDLFVLSGCLSGDGKMDKDGVFGLQRAFKRAGVQSMLLSLWNVDDNVTKEFMILFYKSLFENGNKYMAYSIAQDEVSRKYKDPYYWAAFILLD